MGNARRMMPLVLVAMLMLATSVTPVAGQSAVLTLSPTTGHVDETVTATGAGFEPIGTVELFWNDVNGILLATAPLDRNGGFMVRFATPAEAAPGIHVVLACRDRTNSTCREEAKAEFTVVQTTTTQPPTTTTQPVTTTTAPSSTTVPTTTVPTSTVPTSTVPTSTVPTTTVPTSTVPTSTVPTSSVGVSTTQPIPSDVAVSTTAGPPPTGPPVVAPGARVEWPDIRATGMEVTQGMQNLDNDMPLVEDRRTVVRLYVDVAGQDSWESVTGVLEARRDGAVVGMIVPDNGPITAYANGGSRLDIDHTLNFSLPLEWTSETVQLAGFIWSFNPETVADEPVAVNNVVGGTFEFHPGVNITVHPVALHTHRGGDPADVERTFWGGLLGNDTASGGGLEDYDAGDAMDAFNGLYRYHPVAHVEVEPLPFALSPNGHLLGEEWQFLGCFTTITAVGDASTPDVTTELRVADWTVFFTDAESLDPDDFTAPLATTPDRRDLIVADRVFRIASLSLDPASGETILAGSYPSNQFFGDAPQPGRRAHPSGCGGPGLNNSDPNVQMSLLRAAYDWEPVGEFFIGMLHPLLRSNPGGLASGGDAAWARMFNAYGSGWRHSGGWLVSHEIGHLIGLGHTRCDVSASLDLNHPVESYGQCALAPAGDDGFMGFDVYHDLWPVESPIVFSNDPEAVPEAHRAFPFMGYTREGYPDPYNWCLMLSYYGVPCDPTEIPVFVEVAFDAPSDDLGLPAPPGIDLDSMPKAIIAGVIDVGLGYATFEPRAAHTGIVLKRGYTGSDDLWPAHTPSVRVVDDGVTVFQAPVSLATSQNEVTEVHFIAEIPVQEGFVVEIVDDRAVLATDVIEASRIGDLTPDGPQSATTTAATVPPTNPIPVETEILSMHLRGQGPSLSGLQFQVEYSPDGVRWFPAGSASPTMPETLQASTLRAMPGSDKGQLRVAVRDGFHVGYMDAGTVVIEQKPPVISLSTPHGSMTFDLNRRVRLEAGAIDLEDGSLSDTIEWASSVDGAIAVGPIFESDRLSAGDHTITATVTDSGGLTHTASIALTIDPTDARPRLDAATAEALHEVIAALMTTGLLPPMVANASSSDTAVEPPVEASTDGRTPGFLWVLVLLPVAAGGAYALGRRSRTHAGRPSDD